MTTQPELPVGAPCWMDLLTSDPDKSVAFYTELFGWRARDTGPETEGYRYFERDGNAVGGCMLNQPQFGALDGWSIFLRSEDVRDTAARAELHGGAVLMPPMDVGENGSFVILRDPGGAMISAWQAGTEKGFGILREANVPVWFELHTRDYDKSLDFYRDVFNWDPVTLMDDPNFRYATFAEGEDGKAGIMDATAFLPDEVPASWSVYMGSDDVDATLERAVELGGAVVTPAEDTPYGRLATAIDPTGAVFKLRG